MIEKNAYYEVTFTDLTHDAMGVCKVEGFPVFVKDALKGEKALIKVIKLNKNFGFGRLIEIREESPFRKLPICEHYHVCGGCNTMHMNYQTQLDFKRYRTQETLSKLGKIKTEVKETVGMNNPYYYRNKAIIPFGMRGDKVIAGLYKQRTHEIVNIKRCHIFPRVVSEMVRYLKSLFYELGIEIYKEDIDQGFLKAVMFRHSEIDHQMSITLITRNGKVPEKEEFVRNILERFPNVVSIVQNIQPDQSNVLLGPKHRVLYGKDALNDRLLGLEYEISHRSFYQVNPIQTEQMYTKAMEYAELKPTDRVIDAYCGIGTIGLSAANKVAEVVGIDVVKDAIKNAVQNAKNNQIKNAKFIVGKAEDVMATFTAGSIDVLFVDPPRKGVEKKFLEAIIKLRIPRVVYISCNVSTLARDLNFLQANNYTVREVTPFDMFPQTSHIEAVSVLDYSK